MKPDLASTYGFKVELTPSILVEEVVSETRVFGAAKNKQLGAITNHGLIIDPFGTIMTKGKGCDITLASLNKEEEKEGERRR